MIESPAWGHQILAVVGQETIRPTVPDVVDSRLRPTVKDKERWASLYAWYSPPPMKEVIKGKMKKLSKTEEWEKALLKLKTFVRKLLNMLDEATEAARGTV